MEANETLTENRAQGRPLWLPYVVPMALFLLITTLLEPQFRGSYPALYMAKVIGVTAALVIFRSAWRDIRFEARALPLAALVGLAVFAAWILLDPITPELSFLGARTGYNPFQEIADPVQRGLFIAFRLFGLVLMVPVMEELFWRSFLLRFITNENFTSVPMGTFSGAAFAVVALAFGFAHPEWLAAIVCACAYALLLRRTQSLFSCVAAHAVTNLALGIYVLATQNWKFW